MLENNSQEIENDILVLYVLGQFDMPISDKSLTEIILTPGLINYFSYTTSLENLTKDNLITLTTDTDGLNLYSISEEGRQMLPSLISGLSSGLKQAYDSFLLKEKSKITLDNTINAYPFIDQNKNQCVRCYIRENGVKIVDIRIPVPDRETALMMCANWKTDAYSLLMQIMTDLSGEI